MKFSGYFLTVLGISGAGSVLNTLLWYAEELMYDDSNFRHDFGWYFQIYLLSVILSFISSLVFLIPIWMVENFRRKFTLAIHVLALLIMLVVLFFTRAQLENYSFFLAFYIPGIVAYYWFVYRKVNLKLDDDLLDR